MDKRYTLEGKTWIAGLRGNNRFASMPDGQKEWQEAELDFLVERLTDGCNRASLVSNKNLQRFWITQSGDRRIISWPGGCVEVNVEDLSAGGPGGQAALKPIKLSMPGKVVAIKVKVGDIVEKGDCLLVVEAMKMENNILAEGRAKVKEVLAKQDGRLDSGATLVTFESADE